MSYFVTIARGPRGALRIGRTGNGGGAMENRHGSEPSHRPVYIELFHSLGDAITRERQLKTWQRRWKVDLIERFNPRWEDLSGRFGV